MFVLYRIVLVKLKLLQNLNEENNASVVPPAGGNLIISGWKCKHALSQLSWTRLVKFSSYASDSNVRVSLQW